MNRKGYLLFFAGLIVGIVATKNFVSDTPETASASNAGPGQFSGLSQAPSDRAASLSESANPRPFVDDRAHSELMLVIETDPMAALLDAAALSNPVKRRKSVELVGSLWARVDPVTALESAPALRIDLLEAFQSAVTVEWADLDAAGFLEYAHSAPDPDVLIAGLSALLATDPAQVFELAGRLSLDNGGPMQANLNELQRTALGVLADRNPAVAMQHVESMLNGIGTNVLAQDIVTRFAEQDPDAALEWFESFAGASTSLRRVVLGGVARTDFDRAFELAAAVPTEISFLASAVARGAVSDPERAEETAASLLRDDRSFADEVLVELANNWIIRDPMRFTEWFLDHAGAIDQSLTRTVALRMASSDLDGAMALMDRLPVKMHDDWISQLAGPYASRNPAAAVDWVQQFQGRPFFEEAHSKVVTEAADSDPELIATMIRSFSPPLRIAAAPRVAAGLARNGSVNAAEWALDLTDTDVAAASRAVSNVVSGWVRNDLDSATGWTLALEPGEFKDEALVGLISGSYGTNLDPRPLLEAMTSDDVRRSATRLAVSRVGTNRTDLIQDMLRTLIGDPDYGDWAQESLDRIAGRGQ